MAGRIHPAYTYWANAQTWSQIYARISPGDIVILNPSNGPTPDNAAERQAVIEQITAIRTKHATPLGYVAMGWGDRAFIDVLRDVWSWWSLYGLGRLFFDQAPADLTIGDVAALQRLCQGNWTTAHALVNLVINPGAPCPALPTPMRPGVLVSTYEGPTVPERTWQPWEAALAYDVNGRHSGGPTWQAWTDDDDSNVWDSEDS